MVNKNYFDCLSPCHWRAFSVMLWPDQHYSEGDLPQFLLKLFGHNWRGIVSSLFQMWTNYQRSEYTTDHKVFPSFNATSDVIGLTNSPWTSIITLMRSDWLPLLIDKKKMSLLNMVLIYIPDKEKKTQEEKIKSVSLNFRNYDNYASRFLIFNLQMWWCTLSHLTSLRSSLVLASS